MPADKLTIAVEVLQREIEILKDSRTRNDKDLLRARETVNALLQNGGLIADALTSCELALAKLTT